MFLPSKIVYFLYTNFLLGYLKKPIDYLFFDTYNSDLHLIKKKAYVAVFFIFNLLMDVSNVY